MDEQDVGSAEGGEAKDHDMMMDQCAMELMHAIESKDKESFMQAFHVLVSDVVSKMNPGEDE